MNCRFCNAVVTHEFVDLINSPASNSFLSKEELNEPEIFFPLKVYVCHNCFLVQVDEFKKSDTIFNSEYVYFSSFSTTWLKHSKEYVDMITQRFSLNSTSKVIEIASNDGYLLQYFVEKNIPVLGIEPTKNTAEVAERKGVRTITEFFGVQLALVLKEKNETANLILGNNVLAHVPNINDFVKGMKILLNNDGVVTMEFPHLLQLIRNNQFDTVYHEHFSYLSLYTVKKIFEKQGLEIFDVEEIATHGGSLRIFAKHTDNITLKISNNVATLLEKEVSIGVNTIEYYKGFQKKVKKIKFDLLTFLLEKKGKGKSIAAYGAAAKGNTLINYCGIKNDLIDFVADANPFKQNKYLPASHIPVVSEDYLKKMKPDYIMILPWNLKQEIMEQLSYIKEWGGKFVVAVPQLEVV